MSQNGKDCIWTGSQAACEKLAAFPPPQLQPLECGEPHNKVWGESGYERSNHWCSRSRNLISRDYKTLKKEYMKHKYASIVSVTSNTS